MIVRHIPKLLSLKVVVKKSCVSEIELFDNFDLTKQTILLNFSNRNIRMEIDIWWNIDDDIQGTENEQIR